MTRRDFLQTSSLSLAGLAVAGTVFSASSQKKTMNHLPNILLIQSDQHNPKITGWEKDPWIKTPHLDRLAQEGTVHSACYCPSPLCVPSRVAMLAGVLPSATGVFTNQQSLSSDTPTMAHALAAAGYETTLIGRMHFIGPDQRHGFQHRLVGDICPTILGTDYQVWDGLEKALGTKRETVSTAGPGTSRVTRYDDAVTQASTRFFKDLSPTAPPQFVTVGFFAPHSPFLCPKELFDSYDKKLPPAQATDTRLHDYERDFIKRCDLENFSPEDLRRMKVAYYGLVEKLDRDIGVVLAAADQAWGHGNYLTIYISDHGDMLGERGHINKTWFFEASARVPFIAHWPGHIPAGQRITSPTSLLDLSPTFTELAKAAPLPVQHGKSLLPLWKGGKDTERAVVSQYATTVDGYVSGMVRQGDWKLIYYHGYPHPQLYNLADDPTEQNDLGESPEHAERRASLLAHLMSTWDPEAIKAISIRSWEESQRIAQANRAQRIADPEVWVDPARGPMRNICPITCP